ncbi:MAG: hypothetical protein A2Z66_06165 [Chloroflexi bacterium RBG_13_66_10]|nr:MAG: hypothetical protein A2Z66_06165 [Chloroflexi bacterium RBG_13_66_10]
MNQRLHQELGRAGVGRVELYDILEALPGKLIAGGLEIGQAELELRLRHIQDGILPGGFPRARAGEVADERRQKRRNGDEQKQPTNSVPRAGRG